MPPKFGIPLAAALVGSLVIGVMWQASTVEATYAAVVLPSPTLDETVVPHTAASTNQNLEVAVFAGGCFWGVQAVFQHVKGVLSAVSGYAGGDVANPTYDQVSLGQTGDAEVVQVTFDPTKISYGTLLQVYFSVAHDPTLYDRQGPDVGPEYRSEIFFTTSEQADIARAYIAQLNDAAVYPGQIVTKVQPLDTFWRGEDFHQDYATVHPSDPYVATIDRPKLTHLRDMFPELWRDEPVLVLSHVAGSLGS